MGDRMMVVRHRGVFQVMVIKSKIMTNETFELKEIVQVYCIKPWPGLVEFRCRYVVRWVMPAYGLIGVDIPGRDKVHYLPAADFELIK
jgi:hypothetical protein